jgi:hypothetical protein
MRIDARPAAYRFLAANKRKIQLAAIAVSGLAYQR